jgi:hypothetical protein
MRAEPTHSPAADGGPTHLESEEVVLAAVARALREIEFGSVLIKIHQGEVVGIETSTKVRLKGGKGSL